MKPLKLLPLLMLVFYLSCAGAPHKIKHEKGETQTGVASWYGPMYHGRTTASGEVYNMYDLTAAHQTLPFGTMVHVRNLENNKTVVVKINDRGPFKKNRIIDLSYEAAKQLDMMATGTAKVKITVVK